MKTLPTINRLAALLKGFPSAPWYPSHDIVFEWSLAVGKNWILLRVLNSPSVDPLSTQESILRLVESKKRGGTESFPFPFLSYPFPALKLSLNNLSWNFETFPTLSLCSITFPTILKHFPQLYKTFRTFLKPFMHF